MRSGNPMEEADIRENGIQRRLEKVHEGIFSVAINYQKGKPGCMQVQQKNHAMTLSENPSPFNESRGHL